VWHHSLLLMNSFNKSEAAVFFLKAILPEGFPFGSFIYNIIASNNFIILHLLCNLNTSDSGLHHKWRLGGIGRVVPIDL